jgi:hypothetical protein
MYENLLTAGAGLSARPGIFTENRHEPLIRATHRHALEMQAAELACPERECGQQHKPHSLLSGSNFLIRNQLFITREMPSGRHEKHRK